MAKTITNNQDSAQVT